VEEVNGKHAGGLRAQELPPTRIGPPHRRRWYPVALQDLADRRGADAVAELEQLALDLLYPQFGFSVAIRTTSAASTSLIGGDRDVSGRSTSCERGADASAGWCSG
jgi:hypothetical protein